MYVHLLCFIGASSPRIHYGLALLKKKSNVDQKALKEVALQCEHDPL